MINIIIFIYNINKFGINICIIYGNVFNLNYLIKQNIFLTQTLTKDIILRII